MSRSGRFLLSAKLLLPESSTEEIQMRRRWWAFPGWRSSAPGYGHGRPGVPNIGKVTLPGSVQVAAGSATSPKPPHRKCRRPVGRKGWCRPPVRSSSRP